MPQATWQRRQKQWKLADVVKHIRRTVEEENHTRSRGAGAAGLTGGEGVFEAAGDSLVPDGGHRAELLPLVDALLAVLLHVLGELAKELRADEEHRVNGETCASTQRRRAGEQTDVVEELLGPSKG
eukprot:5689017-Pleurochrysis_carterae.AAC.4